MKRSEAVARLRGSSGKGPRILTCGVPVTVDEVRAFAVTLPRSSEVFVRGRLKFRIGKIVYLSFSRDGETMGFAFPKEWRDALVESEPEKFSLPDESDLRFHWAHVRLAAIDSDEMRELVGGAWAMVVPKRVAAAYAASGPTDTTTLFDRRQGRW